MNLFDRATLEWLNGLHGFAPLDGAMRVIATDYLLPLAFALSLVALWFIGKGREQRFNFQMTVLHGMFAVGLANVAVWQINLAWDRPRPFEALPGQLDLLFYPPTDPSFPANPVAVGFAVGAAIWRVNRMFGAAVLVSAAFFGFSRVYAGVFWPTDIIGGAAVGMVGAWGAVWFRRLLEPLPTLFIRVARAVGLA
ncbi:MAG: phosphatase PAP2 family protein [Dehalococcoidia bacterium]|nr:phosphatase PAP2 family protein [Dehalococcoidia bacterium]